MSYDSDGQSDTYNVSAVELDNLIFNETNCDDQACEELAENVLMYRRQASESDAIIRVYGYLGCPGNDRSCYNVHDIRYNGDYTYISEEVVNSSWTKMKCTEAMVCDHVDDKLTEMKDFDAEDYKAKSNLKCPQNDDKQSGKGGRKKRQTGPKEEEEVVAEYQREADFMRQYVGLAPTTKRDMGHWLTRRTNTFGMDVDGLLRACTYRGKSCKNESMWMPFPSASYGICYTFNSARNTEDSNVPRKSSLTGSANGLTIEIFVDQTHYMGNTLSKNAGARMILHDPKQEPLPDEDGIDLSPSSSSSISTTLTEVRKLASPYDSDCITHWNASEFDDPVFEYTYNGCLRHCYQIEIVSNCSCFYPYIGQGESYGTNGKNSCDVDINSDDYGCYMQVLQDFDSGERNCDGCKVACVKSSYNTAVTTSTWPSDQYWKDIAIELGHPQNLVYNEIQGAEIKADIQADYAKANIYIRTLDVQSIEESPKYTLDGFAAGLGGALSLFLGVAIVMIFELIELLGDLFVDGISGDEEPPKRRTNKNNR